MSPLSGYNRYKSRLRAGFRKRGAGSAVAKLARTRILRKAIQRKVYANTTGAGGSLSIPFKNFSSRHPFPINMWTKFTYTESLFLANGATNTVGTTYKLGLNALWDVYLAAGGHQPYGFDSLVSANGPYYRYKVWSVRLDLEFYDPSADSGIQICCAVHNPVSYAAGATISGLSIDQVSEKHNTFTKYISSTGAQTVRVSRVFPMHQLFNLTKAQFANDISTTTGSNAGNPASTPVLEIGILDSRSNTCSVMVKGMLTFNTQLYDRAQLSQS